MMKKINWKKLALVSLWSVFAIGLFIMLGFVNTKRKAQLCTTINVKIDESVPHDFIDQAQVLELVNATTKIKGKPLGAINTSLLEKIIMSNSYVQEAEVYSTVDGKLQIDVLQRNPLVRIINMRDEHFYIDHAGKFMPVCAHYSTPVIVANGYIFDSYSAMEVPHWSVDSLNSSSPAGIKKTILEQIFEVAAYAEQDTFLNALIEQVYVNQQQEIELIPRVGNHRIILGSTENLPDKFNRLYIFYTKGLNKTGWNNYSVINLKYQNQVVCTKIKS